VDAFIHEASACGSIAGVGVRAVVERAGCTAPVLYRLFGDRAGLVRMAVRSIHLPMLDRLEAIAADGDASATERFRALARSYLRRNPGESEVFAALVSAECRSNPRLARLVREVFRRFERLLVGVVREGMKRGEFHPEADPHYAAWRLIDLGLFRNQVRLMGLRRPDGIDYAVSGVQSLLAEIAAPPTPGSVNLPRRPPRRRSPRGARGRSAPPPALR
jgi:AcrR family transcriptional regulator